MFAQICVLFSTLKVKEVDGLSLNHYLKIEFPSHSLFFIHRFEMLIISDHHSLRNIFKLSCIEYNGMMTGNTCEDGFLVECCAV
jgi:hypothetical protein